MISLSHAFDLMRKDEGRERDDDDEDEKEREDMTFVGVGNTSVNKTQVKRIYFQQLFKKKIGK